MSPRRQPLSRAPAPGRGGQPAKREAILDAARRVFLANGYSETSVDAVAAEAGVSKQTVYNHFGDKKTLFLAVMRTAQAGTSERFAELETWTGTAEDLDRELRAVGRALVRAILRPDIAAFRRLVLAEAGRHPELLEEWAQARPALETALAAEIERRAARGQLDVPDPRLAAHQFVLLVATEASSRSVYALRELPDHELDQIVGDGVDMWLRCYRSRQATANPNR